ncbi:hypothetical protein KAH81_00300 [bacterium]|nr:hypothetical protein [bacterium]
MFRSVILLSVILVIGAIAQVPMLTGGDYLGETPIYDIPSDMTFEDYRDANRRISVGLMLMSVPVPGMLHFYADDDREGWFCVGAAGLGLTSIAIGAMLHGDEQWPESDFDVITIDGNRYEKIPKLLNEDKIEYKLNRIEQTKEMETGGAILISLGAVLVVGQVIYDWIDGISTIEYKRDAVRYKYGIGGYGASLEPHFDNGVGLTMTLE